MRADSVHYSIAFLTAVHERRSTNACDSGNGGIGMGARVRAVYVLTGHEYLFIYGDRRGTLVVAIEEFIGYRNAGIEPDRPDRHAE